MSYPHADVFASRARLRLAASTRQLVDAVLTTPAATDAELDAATARTDATVRALRAVDREGPPAAAEQRHDDYLPRSPFVGSSSPLAPPFDYELTGGRLVAHGVFGPAYEGPPGYVHGGWVALAFDEALGMANIASGHPGLTGRLTIRYRRPTPLHTPLVLEAHTTGVDGRRITTIGSLCAGDALTAEAEGLFVVLGAERALEYFGERPMTPEPTDPLP